MTTVDAVLTASGVIACVAAGVPEELAHALVWETPPHGEQVKQRAWKVAREVFAAHLLASGWATAAISIALGVSEAWVRTSHKQHSDLFERPDLPQLLDS